MRYNKLSSLVRQLRAEARLSTSSSTGLEADEYLVQLIRRTYETLWEDWDWEHSQLTRAAGEITLVAGTYRYDIPADAYYEGIRSVWGQDSGGQWRELLYGIGLAEMNAHDSDADERADPVQRWVAYDQGTKTQIEVWPIPESAGKIAVVGKKKPNVLKDGDAIVNLDDIVVVLFAAAEVLAESKPKEAQLKADAARARLLQLRVKAAPKTRWAVGRGEVPLAPRQYGELKVQWVSEP